MRDYDLPTNLVNPQYVNRIFNMDVAEDMTDIGFETVGNIIFRNAVLSDDNLQQYLNLSIYDGVNSVDAAQGFFFYLRSWKISAEAIKIIIEELSLDGV